MYLIFMCSNTNKQAPNISLAYNPDNYLVGKDSLTFCTCRFQHKRREFELLVFIKFACLVLFYFFPKSFPQALHDPVHGVFYTHRPYGGTHSKNTHFGCLCMHPTFRIITCLLDSCQKKIIIITCVLDLMKVT